MQHHCHPSGSLFPEFNYQTQLKSLSGKTFSAAVVVRAADIGLHNTSMVEIQWPENVLPGEFHEMFSHLHEHELFVLIHEARSQSRFCVVGIEQSLHEDP